MTKDKWRRPGQNYVIDVAGLGVTCKPMTRGETMALVTSSRKLGEGESALESFYKEIQSHVVSVEGIDAPISEIFNYQSNEVMLELFKGLIGSADLGQAEVKNSSSLPDTLAAEPSKE